MHNGVMSEAVVLRHDHKVTLETRGGLEAS